MKRFDIPVGNLQVVAYTKIVCSHSPPHTWNLSQIPVRECAYYHCAKTGDREFFDDYIDIWSIRTPRVKTAYTYERFLNLLGQIRDAKGYRAELAGRDSMRTHRGTRCLYDGHHRAAIICALFGADTIVPVEEGRDSYPTDLDFCARGLPPLP